jgi:uncharacterized membrane protein
MLFFLLMLVISAIAFALQRLGAREGDWAAAMRWGMALALVFTGLDHLFVPQRYLPMMPEFVPWHREIVFFTGICEIAGALGLLVGRLRALAGLMLVPTLLDA